MGASWILNTENYSFLTADCEHKDLNGVIDNKSIYLKVNEEDAEKAREILLKAGIAPSVDEHVAEDAYKRVSEKQDHFFD